MVQFAHNDMWLLVLWVFCERAFLNNEKKEVQTANAFDQSPPICCYRQLLKSASYIGCSNRMLRFSDRCFAELV
jgi:hypothetical protein